MERPAVTGQPDLVLDRGMVFDGSAGRFVPGRLRVRAGRIVDPDLGSPGGERVVDVEGLLVSPGLVDLHTHVFVGQDAGVSASTLGPPSGVTTMIDAGSAGGHLFDAFRATSIEPSTVRVRAFLNIASIGITSMRLRGELHDLAYCDEDAAIAAIQRHRDVIVGVKVRASADVAGSNALTALERARRVASVTGLPLMVHLGPSPAGVDDILRQLQAGDILTHCFTGFPGNQLIADGIVRQSFADARARGVIFDIGHGASGFDAVVARHMMDHDAPPDTISTDLHAYSVNDVGGLPSVMSKLLALGMPLGEIFASVTSRPAQATGLAAEGVGTLRVGAPADVAVFRVIDEELTFRDGHGHVFGGQRRIEPVMTVVGGDVLYEAEHER